MKARYRVFLLAAIAAVMSATAAPTVATAEGICVCGMKRPLRAEGATVMHRPLRTLHIDHTSFMHRPL